MLRPQGLSRFVLICDHASNHVPAELGGLGVSSADLARHIAWDIGAAAVTEALSEHFDAPASLSGVSRLVIDCNRHEDAATLIPEVSDATVIPGNAALGEAARRERIDRWFRPYHDAVESIFLERESRGVPSIALSIHSMTPSLTGGPARPWQIALSSHTDRSLADPVLTALRAPGGIVVGDNEPYNLDPAFDYSIPFHALRRGLRQIQVEFRQDEIADAAGQRRWALRFAQALTSGIP